MTDLVTDSDTNNEFSRNDFEQALKFQKRIITYLLIALVSTLLVIGLLAIEVFIPTGLKKYSLVDSKTEVLNILKRDAITPLPSEEELAIGELRGIVQSLGDPYSEYLTFQDKKNLEDSLNERYSGVGIGFQEKNSEIVIYKIISNSPALESGLQKDDKLLSIDGASVTGLGLSDIAQKIRGLDGTKVSLEIMRGEQNLVFDLQRRPISPDLVTLDIIGESAVITITSFGNDLDAKMKEVANKITNDQTIKKIILDLRSNTGGILSQAIEATSYFVNPGEIIVQEKSKNDTLLDKSSVKTPSLKDYPVTVLVDKLTASASEIMAAALKELKSAKLVGQKTFGKGVVQKIYELSGGSSLKLTIAQWLTPKGNMINGIGLEPDVVLPISQDSLEYALK